MGIVNRWITALRGGGFTQTTNRLRDKVGFCCLGVACDLHASETGLGYWEFEAESPDAPRGPGYAYVIVDQNGEEVSRDRTVLPFVVREYFGLNSPDGTYDGGYTDDGYGALSEDNDAGKTFADIARVIERRPNHLFRS